MNRYTKTNSVPNEDDGEYLPMHHKTFTDKFNDFWDMYWLHCIFLIGSLVLLASVIITAAYLR